jgi:hypothetical protein
MSKAVHKRKLVRRQVSRIEVNATKQTVDQTKEAKWQVGRKLVGVKFS